MSVQPADIRRHLEQLLREESVLLVELEQILRREVAVVSGEDAVAIEQIGGARRLCVDALSRLDADRVATCRMLSFPGGREGFEQLLSWCDPSLALQQRWQENLLVAGRCKILNDGNGAVVTLKLGQVQKRLATLRGGKVGDVYGRGGASYDGFTQRALGQA